MSTRRSARSTVLTALLVGPLALGLVACGDDDSDDRDDAAERAASSVPSSSAPAAPSASTPASTPASAPTDDSAVLAAAETAVGAVDGGTLFALDLEAAGWDAEVVAADGTASDLALAADGGSVTREPVVDTDDADDTDDLTERQQLLTDATLDAAGAVEAARGAVPAGTITGLDLDLSAGTAVWEVQLDEAVNNDGGATEQTVIIDAATGEVLRTETDD